MSVRSFVAVPLEGPVKEALVAAQSALRKQLSNDVVVRWTKPAQFHLTLEFLGDLSDEEVAAAKERVRAASQRVTPFGLELTTLSSFGRPPRVVWVGVAGELGCLQRLQQHVASGSSDATSSGKFSSGKFRPHLTLGRIKRPPPPDELRQVLEHIDIPRQRWTVREIILYQSSLSRTGAHYTPLLRRSLAASPK
ncbi:MAG: RNA 2',3'-cyclic phosphodiesterase [Trueperaceae bacterium]|nr:RNA 2',3'-cyclic phosphodiesterase [Trueperaceae bacterium]